MRAHDFHPSHLLNRFTFTPPRWLARVPIWAIAIALVALPMLARALYVAWQLPAPLGTLVGVNDPDPWLRLTLVRDWLEGGSWYSHEMLRSNAPYAGISSPWTRPLDVVIALLVWAQPAAESTTLALHRAALLLPALWMALLLGGMAYAMRQLRAAPAAIFMTIALLGTMPVMWNYFGLGNADHHAPLCALWVWTVALLLTPTTRHCLIAGVLLALMLWMSPEALVLIGALYAFFGLQWVLTRRSAAPLATLATAVSVGTVFAVMVERPPEAWLTPIYDSISVVYAFILVLAAALLRFIHLGEARLATRTSRLLAGKLAVSILLLAIWQVFPLAFKGPMAEVDAFIHTHFLPRITEAQPLLSEQPIYVIAMLVQPIVALIIAWHAITKPHGVYSTTQGQFLLYVLLVTLALYFSQQRWYYYCYPLVVMTLVPWLAALFAPTHPAVAHVLAARRLAKFDEKTQALRRAPIFLVVFLLPLTLLLVMPDRATENSKRIDACQQHTRKLIHGGALNTLANGKPLNMLISTDVGGEMLFFTPHRIVASNYHREGKGMEYVWEAWKIPNPASLRQHLAKRQIDAILYCPDATQPTDGFLRRLSEGKAALPAWLAPMHLPAIPATPGSEPAPDNAEPYLYRVIR